MGEPASGPGPERHHGGHCRGLRGRDAPLFDGPDDLLATIQAEDRFDLTDRLGELRVPVLVVGGSRDQYYDSGRIFAQTADRIPGARLVLYPGKGHLGALSSKRLPQDVLAFLDEDAPR